MDSINVTCQVELRLEGHDGDGVKGIADAALHLNLEAIGPLCDTPWYLVVIPTRRIPQAVCVEV